MKDQKGQALVELAIALPLVIVLLCGMVDFGWLVYVKSAFTNAARVGARMAVVTENVYPEEHVLSPTGSIIVQAMDKSLTEVKRDTAILNYQRTLRDEAGNAKTGKAVTGDQVVVTISCPDYPTFSPIWKVLSLLSSEPLSGPIKVSGKASMRYE